MINKQIDCDKLNLDPDILAKAMDGDAIAQLKLGKTLFSKSHTEDNYLSAFELIHILAKQGNMDAQFRLADLYALGQGTQTSQENAYRWYTEAALQGYKKALIRIHNLYQQDKRMYCRGQLDSGEEAWADEGFKKERGIRELNEYRREQYVPVLNNAVDYYTDKFRYYKSSHQENTEFDLNLAFLYQYGYGTKKNILLAFDFYKKAAEQGHKDAQYGLAILYQSNPNMKFNYRHALRWYRASATNGNVAAQNCLGYFYEKGLGTELNFEGALYWYTKAANAENSSAQLTLGRLYRKGQGATQSLSEAAKWYRLAANQGNSAAQNCLNQLYLTGKIPNISNNKDSVSQLPATFTLRSKLQRDINNHRNSACMNKLKLLAQHALMTDGNAMYQIGLKYYNGEDFSQDKDAGFQWIKKAAKAGLEVAESKIAQMYKDGEEVDQDYYKSSIWTMNTVKKRSDTSMLKLGILYKNGLGVRKDPLEASKWFLKSAEERNTHAQFQYGLLRYYGEGVCKDKNEAFTCFFKLALLGNADSLYQLGWIYENTNLTEIEIYRILKIHSSAKIAKDYDITRAIQFYKSAASLGSRAAQFRLAKIYERGTLVKQDLTRAHKYYSQAAESNNPHYRTELALKYLNGVIEDVDYIQAFDLFKKAAEKGDSRATRIFQTPIRVTDDISDYSKVIDMLIFASLRGAERLEYNIGYAYEHGISVGNETLFRKSYPNSKSWYSIAAQKGDYRTEYNTNGNYELGKRIKKYLNIASDSYNLALMYYNEKRESQDFINAFNLFTVASNMGHEEARKKLYPSDYSKNVEMLETVADTGNVAVQYQLGIFFENKNNAKSIQWFTLAAEGGISDACYRLGKLYEKGKYLHRNILKAIDLYKKAVEKDHEGALYKLAQIYHHGKGTDHDYLKAYNLYKRAAIFGHRVALKVLNLHPKQKANSQEKATIEAISMFEFVAKQGDADLQFKLGYFYENDKNNQNHSEAFKWYEIAAKNNHTEATFRLGLLYEKGLGTKQNYNMSVQLYNQAKDQGSHCALYRLGVAFHHGYGVNKSPKEAVDCYTKASELGNHESQYTLGKLYEESNIVERDIIKALILYTNAYMNGNNDVLPSLYNLYDDKPYECFFDQKLFRILTRFEESQNTDSDKYPVISGYMHYRLGKMYLEKIDTKENAVRALKMFLKAKNQYGYSDARPFTTMIYDEYRDKKETYTRRMDAYFELRETIDSEQQYRLGMIHYADSNYYYEKSRKKNKTAVSKKYHTAYQYLFLASKNGHKKAQYQLGIMYILGYGVPQNEENAIEWIKKSMEVLTPDMCYKLGRDFYTGNGVLQNYNLSFIYLKKAAESNHFEARALLGAMYYFGHGVDKSFHESTKWMGSFGSNEYYRLGIEFYKGNNVDKNYEIASAYIKRAAEKNHSNAQAQLALMYLYGFGVEKNHDKAIKWIYQSIKEKNSYKCYIEGMKFYCGNSVHRNYEIALIHIKKAAAQKYGKAQSQLGIMYLYGYGTEQKHEEAIKWIERSIKEMDMYDCYTQGMEFYLGTETDKDYNIAAIYLKKAAKEGHSKAQAQLGSMYLNGRGVGQNQEEAMRWILKSAENMKRTDFYYQGMRFYKGDGTDRSYEIAFVYLNKAAEENHSKAQAQLGSMYFHGYGVKKNHGEALKWIQKSIEQMDVFDCYDQGMHFYRGNDFDRSYELALIYIKRAAEKNYSKAQAQLEIMCLYGYALEKKFEEAVGRIQRSTKITSSYTCYDIGMDFYRGNKIDKSYEIALVYIAKAAEENDREAQTQLGMMYFYGHGVEKNHDKGMEWIQESMKEMNGYNCYLEGIQIYFDNDIDNSSEIAFAYIKKAAEENYIKAQVQLGIMYFHGYGVEKNLQEAMKWIQQSVKKMDKDQCFKKGMEFYRNTKVKDEVAFLYIKKAAKRNQRRAQAQLSILYAKGHGIEEDMDKAKDWAELCVKYLSPKDCYSYGLSIYNYKGVGDYYKLSLTYFKKATEEGHIHSQIQLAHMYLKGQGVSRDYDDAIQLYSRFLDSYPNHPAVLIGQIYHYDSGGIQNFSKALEWYNRETGRKEVGFALHGIGLLYEYGDGVSQSYSEAFKYYKQSTEYNNIAGYYNLGLLYYHGRGVNQNYSKAFSLFSKVLPITLLFNENLESRADHKIQGDEDVYIFIEDKHVKSKVDAIEPKYRKYSIQPTNKIHSKASYYIGLMYENGQGVVEDKQKAWHYFKTASNMELNMPYVFLK